MITWKDFIDGEYKKGYLKDILEKVRKDIAANKKICPGIEDVFACFNRTPRDKVKVVILGQDPYIGEGQAHGLSFSVKPGMTIPPSLANIYQEIRTDLGRITKNKDGCLTPWADQGVLLLNTILTTELGKSLAHAAYGWQKFTDAVIQDIVKNNSNAVFVLWGNEAQKKLSLLDPQTRVITSVHPSPMSARNGFFGSKPFSKINEMLVASNQSPIDW